MDRPVWRALAPLPMIAWVLWRASQGEWRWEYVLFLLVAPLLAWTTGRARRLFRGLYPFAILGLVYDAMRFVRNVGITPERVHVCDLRALEVRWFGAGGSTLHDWFQAHPSTLLDLICAVPYGTFIAVQIAFAIYLYAKDYDRMLRFGWTFLLVNLCGFVTYHAYPAAPPWYFHAHGCVADLATHASEGPALARVDAILGVPYFASFYGRSASVFGAVPSLHVTYPLLVVVVGWPLFRSFGRAASLLFFATMCFAAVYLDHHWVLDVLLGVSYTLLVDRAVLKVLSLRERFVGGASHAPPPRPPVPRDARSRVAYALATWFGCGNVPYAPGTAGTLGAIPLYVAVRALGGAPAVLAAAIIVTFVGVWASSVVVAHTGSKDPQFVVIDEVAGVLFALAACPPTVLAAVVAFLAFRLFDVLKPWPAYVAERSLPGGWGVVFDDVFAGAWGAGVIAILVNVGVL